MRRKYKSKRSSRARSFGIDRTTDPPTAWRRTAGGGYTTHELGSKIDVYGATAGTATQEQRMARARDRFVGWGDYRRAGRTALRAGGALAGGILGGMTGGVGGAFRGARGGWSTGARASKFLGLGDYAANQIMPGGRQPMSVNGSSTNLTGDVTVSHREFIGNISADVLGFQNRSFPINAGLSATFPFLSQIAQNFTLYQFEGLIFEFISTSGETSTSTNALGKVVLAVDYDPDASPFVNAVQMSNMDYAVSSRPSDNIRCGVETAPSQMATRMQYIRTGEGTRDKIFTDIGNFQLATDGVPNTGILGELWVAYTCRLSRAQLSVTGFGTNIKYDNIIMQSSAINIGGNTPTLINTLGLTGIYEIQPGQTGAKYVVGGDYLGGSLTAVPGQLDRSFKYEWPTAITNGVFKIDMYNVRAAGSNPFFVLGTLVGCNVLRRPEYPLGIVVNPDDLLDGDASFPSTTSSQSLFTCYLVVNTTSTVEASFVLTTSTGAGCPADAKFVISVAQCNSSLTGGRVIG